MRRPVPARAPRQARDQCDSVDAPSRQFGPRLMPAVQVVVLSEVPDRRRLLRLVGSLGETSWVERATDLAPAPHTAAVIVADVVGLDVTTLGSSLDMARRRMPVLLVILVAASGPAHLHTAIAAASRIRAVESVAAGWYDVFPLTIAAMRHADVLLCAEHVTDGVRARVPRSLLPFIEYCAGRTETCCRVPDVVERAGLKRRTLDSRLRRAGLPTAERILGWCRVLHAAWRLDRSDDSVERIALTCGLTSASALRNYYRRYSGLSPTEARARGGFGFLLDQFRAEVSRPRGQLEHRHIGRDSVSSVGAGPR
jgi:AraC-like DNA-binding protein